MTLVCDLVADWFTFADWNALKCTRSMYEYINSIEVVKRDYGFITTFFAKYPKLKNMSTLLKKYPYEIFRMMEATNCVTYHRRLERLTLPKMLFDGLSVMSYKDLNGYISHFNYLGLAKLAERICLTDDFDKFVETTCIVNIMQAVYEYLPTIRDVMIKRIIAKIKIMYNDSWYVLLAKLINCPFVMDIVAIVPMETLQVELYAEFSKVKIDMYNIKLVHAIEHIEMSFQAYVEYLYPDHRYLTPSLVLGLLDNKQIANMFKRAGDLTDELIYALWMLDIDRIITILHKLSIHVVIRIVKLNFDVIKMLHDHLIIKMIIHLHNNDIELLSSLLKMIPYDERFNVITKFASTQESTILDNWINPMMVV